MHRITSSHIEMNTLLNLKYTKNHLWLRMAGKQDFYVGVTTEIFKNIGSIRSIEMLPEGVSNEKDGSAGTLIGVRDTAELSLPFAAKILIINHEVVKSPGFLYSDPYYYWICLVSTNDYARGPSVLSSKDYTTYIKTNGPGCSSQALLR